jgi:hypothetical protein
MDLSPRRQQTIILCITLTDGRTGLTFPILIPASLEALRGFISRLLQTTCERDDGCDSAGG